jgi:hypothetical protein
MITIDRNTEAPPPVKPTHSGPPNAIMVKLKIPLLFGIGDGAVVLFNLFQKALCQPLRDKGLLLQDPPSERNSFHAKDAANVVTVGTQTIGLFQVTNLKAGLETLRDELADLEGLQFSEIGYLDTAGSWRGWQPPDAETDFPATLKLLKSWIEKTKPLRPQ